MNKVQIVKPTSNTQQSANFWGIAAIVCAVLTVLTGVASAASLLFVVAFVEWVRFVNAKYPNVTPPVGARIRLY